MQVQVRKRCAPHRGVIRRSTVNPVFGGELTDVVVPHLAQDHGVLRVREFGKGE